MEKIDYNSVKRKIERELCVTHNQHPKFEKTHKGFNISACCEAFQAKIVKKTETIMADETKVAIEKMLSKAFR
ncbi:hypothetical protein [Aequorivita sinensis]|uniref:hypothetical protein n=1 Tax=Aequorivita sinensis TaxID=1382458 RepID=UPI00111E31D0|nr:hypothetical protein [Aequorivita sinensis]